MATTYISGDAEERRSGGRFSRHMLRNVRPDHVAEMIDMLHVFGHGEKRIEVPDGPWWMPMPHGYLLRGKGPVGIAIEPSPELLARRGNGDLFRVSKLDERDTEGIVRLTKRVLKLNGPERDTIITQLYALNFDQCDQEAVQAVEEMTWDLIVNE